MASDTARIDEVAADIFRINVVLPRSPLTFSFFLIRDEQPTLVETGFSRPFPITLDAVTRLVDPATLRWIVIPHTESDESGALNQFLDVAPHAVPVGSPIGVVTNLSDLASRDPMAVADGDETDTMIAAYQQVGIFPSRAHLDAALDKIEAISPATLAAHHGSVKASAIGSYLAALREADVTGLTDWNPMA